VRRIAWTALRNKVLSPQHREALLKQLVIDLVTLFTYNVKTAFTRSKEVTMFTLDVQRVFNALLKKQLLKHMTKQGWPFSLL
jgi:hypothetical protein